MQEEGLFECIGGDVKRLLSLHLLPTSMPLTATFDTVRSTAFRPSLTVSVADFWKTAAVEKRRGDGRAAADRRAMFDL